MVTACSLSMQSISSAGLVMDGDGGWCHSVSCAQNQMVLHTVVKALFIL